MQFKQPREVTLSLFLTPQTPREWNKLQISWKYFVLHRHRNTMCSKISLSFDVKLTQTALEDINCKKGKRVEFTTDITETTFKTRWKSHFCKSFIVVNIVICDECKDRAPTDEGAPPVPRSGGRESLFQKFTLRMRRATCLSVCPSVRLNGTTRFPLEKFFTKF